ncbi:MAG: hypothetical protein CBC01_01495 [Betaproteobacteria bacterium TMED41]|nr:MAG: hypothetical protein CBC01_01495 [Betaproteobacteria bacterium TMED41]|tara:strand:+ start:233 stop:670 length:438 start_codon:yes stop_codon:yes gene_type:complete
MKVFNLQCGEGHSFEGWFRSEEDFISQNSKGLSSCPICDSTIINRLPSAAHIQSNKNKVTKNNHNSISDEVQKKIVEVAKEILKDSENVGSRFAEEARKIHRNESEMRSIHGTATHEESKALKEEGIDILTLPIEKIRKKPTSLQ